MSKQTHNVNEEPSVNLDHWRAQIDVLDAQLMQLLAQRLQAVEAIGQIKRAQGLNPLDEKRWQEVLQSKLSMARELGLSAEFIHQLYELIHEYSLSVESLESRESES